MSQEHHDQVAVMKWAVLQSGRYPELAGLHATPNGGHRSKATAGRLKAEGVKAGVPDLCLPLARAGYGGLHLEMKAKRGTVRPTQKWWLKYLNGAGQYAAVARGFDEAVEIIMAYLNEDAGTLERMRWRAKEAA